MVSLIVASVLEDRSENLLTIGSGANPRAVSLDKGLEVRVHLNQEFQEAIQPADRKFQLLLVPSVGLDYRPRRFDRSLLDHTTVTNFLRFSFLISA